MIMWTNEPKSDKMKKFSLSSFIKRKDTNAKENERNEPPKKWAFCYKKRNKRIFVDKAEQCDEQELKKHLGSAGHRNR